IKPLLVGKQSYLRYYMSLTVSPFDIFKIEPVKVNTRKTQESVSQKPDSSFTFDLLSLNTWLKPGITGTDVKERIPLIADSLDDFEIVALQETFSEHSNSIPLIANIKAIVNNQTLFESFRPKDSNFYQEDAGLTTMAKYKIIDKAFKPFSYSSGMDSL